MASTVRISGVLLRMVLPEGIEGGELLPPFFSERLAEILAPAGVRCDFSAVTTTPADGIRAHVSGIVFHAGVPEGASSEAWRATAAAIEALLAAYFVETDFSHAEAEAVAT